MEYRATITILFGLAVLSIEIIDTQVTKFCPQKAPVLHLFTCCKRGLALKNRNILQNLFGSCANEITYLFRNEVYLCDLDLFLVLTRKLYTRLANTNSTS